MAAHETAPGNSEANIMNYAAELDNEVISSKMDQTSGH
jgi:hypothetical protein